MKINKCDFIRDTSLNKLKDRLADFIRFKEDVSISMTSHTDVLGVEYVVCIV